MICSTIIGRLRETIKGITRTGVNRFEHSETVLCTPYRLLH